MKFRKKETPTQEPRQPETAYYRPQILRETKNYRLVKKQTLTTSTNIATNAVTGISYIELVLETKDKNAMEEPFWKTKQNEMKKGGHGYYSIHYDHKAEELWDFIREMLNP